MKHLIYVGIIADWMDIDLVRKLGNEHVVTLVGEKRVELPGNVHYHGIVAYEELPNLITGCDAGIIPFHRNKLTEEINNSKIYQYYACGVPVVTTLDNRASRDSLALISNSHKEFLANIELAGCIDMAPRRKIALQHDWQKLADSFAQAL